MKSIKTVWQTLRNKADDLLGMRRAIDERNRALNTKVDSRQITRARLRDRAYGEMRKLKVPRKVQREMARAKANREWRDLHDLHASN